LRIGFDVRSLQSGSPPWGIGVYTFNLLQNLASIDDRNEYFLISFRGRAFDLSFKFPEGFKVNHIEVPFFMKQLNVFRDRIFLRRELKSYRLDVIHFPSPFHLTLDYAPGEKNNGTVITVFDLTPTIYRREIFTGRRRILELFYRFLLGSVNHTASIIAISENTSIDLQRILGTYSEKIKVIHLGVSRNFRRDLDDDKMLKTRARYNLPAHYLFYIGNFFPFKNLASLFEALHILEKDHSISIPLIIGGEIHPFFRKNIESLLVRWDIQKRVTLLGFIPEADLPFLYHMADIFIYPSLYEGFGLPPLEAMACGTPVACSSTSSLPEVVGKAARLFDPHSAEQIAQAISEILGNEALRTNLIEKGLKQAGLFTWELCARKTLELYHEVSARKSTVT